MASMTMATSAASVASLLPTKNPATTARRGLLVVATAASRATEGEENSFEMKNKEDNISINGRRELVFAVAAAAACSIATLAMADEPKPGTLEAKKKYAPICVTMPTARICHK